MINLIVTNKQFHGFKQVKEDIKTDTPGKIVTMVDYDHEGIS